MSIVRAIDDQGDWLFGKGQNDYVQANETIMQNIQTRLQSFLGDCFFANDQGLDWFNLLGQNESNRLALNLAVTSVILNTDNVTNLNQLAIETTADRNVKITYSVNTIYTGTVTGTSGSAFVNLSTESGDDLITESGDHIGA